MLTVAKVTSRAAAGYANYLEGRATPAELGDYYLKDGERVEAPGRWVSGGDAVGVDQANAVSGEQLRALMAVKRPDNGLRLRRVGANGEAVAAIDATFSAPKSVSAVWALSSPQLRERIERAHEHAIDRALRHAVEHVPMIRERVDSQTVIRLRPSGLIATSWRHTAARAVDGRPPDPQLHSHVLLHGAIRGDGRIVAIDSRAWLVHGRELGAAYRTELARELAALGFGIERGTGRGGRYFEIAGVPRALLDRWSSRHHQVRAAITVRLRDHDARLAREVETGNAQARTAAELERLRSSGQLAPREDRYLTTATRAAKRHLATHGDLDRYWWTAAQALRFDAAAVERLREPGRSITPADDRELLRRLTEFDATFTEREARAVALEASTGAGIERSLMPLSRLRQQRRVLSLADGTLTTREHRGVERQTVQAAERLAAIRVTAVPERLSADHAAALDTELRANGASLSLEQRAALELACSDRPLVVVEGQAGTGKSKILAAVARAHEADGRQIVVTSTAALAAQRLAGELGLTDVQSSAYSTAALHVALVTGQLELEERTTVIHDEAALASTREQHQLLVAVEESGARVIMVGDPRQSQPVGAGGLWPHLEHAARGNQAHVELTRNVRAQDRSDRRDQRLFRDGHHEQAIEGYRARGRIVIRDDAWRAEEAALEAAHEDRQAGNRTLVMAQTSNEHLDELNARAQAIRIEFGELGAHGVRILGKPYCLHAGDEIQVRRTLTHPHAGAIRNGTAGRVISAYPDVEALRLSLQDGREVVLDEAQIQAADLRLSYVQHPFPAQGQTTDATHLIVAEHATQEGSYVAITRARQQTHIYASREELSGENEPDQLRALAERISRQEPNVPSIRTPLAHEEHVGNELVQTHSARMRENPASNGAERHSADVWQRDREYIANVLGPEPDLAARAHTAWERATVAIERYRTRYTIDPYEPTALGPEPRAGEFQQRHDRRYTALEVLDTRERLGHTTQHAAPIDERILGVPGLVHQSEPERTIGWEP